MKPSFHFILSLFTQTLFYIFKSDSILIKFIENPFVDGVKKLEVLIHMKTGDIILSNKEPDFDPCLHKYFFCQKRCIVSRCQVLTAYRE